MGLFGRGADSTQPATQLQLPSVQRSVPLTIRGGPRSNADHLASQGHVNLSKATVSLQKQLVRIIDAWFDAQVELYVDYSSSMEWEGRRYYSSGYMQQLADRSLAAGLELDVDGSVPVRPFSGHLHRTIDVSLDTYEGVVDREIVRKERTGGTCYAPIFHDVLKRAKVTEHPMIVVVVTDGEPSDEYETKQVLSELSQYPVFVKFLSLESNKFLDDLDDDIGVPMLIDNISCEAFDGKSFPRLSELSDDDFARAFFQEMDDWMNLALGAGVLYES